MNPPTQSKDREWLQHEIEYVLDDDSVGEVRVTYLKDGHSEIKQARVLLSEDIMRLVDGYVNSLKQSLVAEVPGKPVYDATHKENPDYYAGWHEATVIAIDQFHTIINRVFDGRM